MGTVFHPLSVMGPVSVLLGVCGEVAVITHISGVVAAYSRSSSSARGTVVMRLHSRAKSSPRLQPSSSSTMLESHSSLDAVTPAQLTGTSYRRISPSVAPSCTCSRSPMLEGRPSQHGCGSRYWATWRRWSAFFP